MICHLRIPKLWLGLMLLLIPVAGFTEEYNLHIWQVDLETMELDTAGLRTATLDQETPASSWENYAQLFSEKLRESRDQVDPKTYQILENIALALNQDFRQFPEQVNWKNADTYVKTKLDFAHNLIALLDVSRY